jgi:DNA-binding CsgD family transcriptional regulator
LLTPEQLLGLYRSARHSPRAAFLEHCIAWLQRAVAYDSLAITSSPRTRLSYADAQFHGVEEPRALIESYQRVGHLDTLTPRVLLEPHVTHALDWDDDALAGDASAPLREHILAFGLTHTACIAVPDADTDFVLLLFLMRRKVGHRFSRGELALITRAAPHVAEAMIINRANQWLRSPHVAIDELPVALVDAAGCFRQMTPAFARLFWRGDVPHETLYLPRDCLRAVASGTSWRLPGGQQSLTGSAHAQGWLVRLRPVSPVDCLSSRERQVAHEFAAGASYREIATMLALSPATVRRHLSNLYQKLGVASRTELQSLMAE